MVHIMLYMNIYLIIYYIRQWGDQFKCRVGIQWPIHWLFFFVKSNIKQTSIPITTLVNQIIIQVKNNINKNSILLSALDNYTVEMSVLFTNVYCVRNVYLGTIANIVHKRGIKIIVKLILTLKLNLFTFNYT